MSNALKLLFLLSVFVLNSVNVNAQNFDSSLSEHQKKIMVKKMNEILKDHSDQISPFWFGKLENGDLFYTMCLNSRTTFNKGYYLLNYDEKDLCPLVKDETVKMRYDITKNGYGQYEWHRRVHIFDEKGRLNGMGDIIQIRKSKSNEAKIMYSYIKNKSDIDYGENGELVIHNTIYKTKRKKNDKERLKFQNIITEKLVGNKILIKEEKLFYNKKGNVSKVLRESELEIDEFGRTVKSLLKVGGFLKQIETRGYNDRGWLSAYKLTIFNKMGENPKQIEDGFISYELKEDGLDQELMSSYNLKESIDIYNEEKVLFKQIKDSYCRLKKEDRTWGEWIFMTY